MEKERTVAAVEDLNLIIFNNDKNSIPTDIDPEILLEKLKQAALWLYASDHPQESTIEVLKELDWTTDDFENLKNDQDPIPAFRLHGIGPYAKTEEPEPEPVPEPEEEIIAGRIEESEDAVQEHTEAAPPVTKPEKKGPSAYGTALALMGPDPEMPLHELYEAMKEQGFDLQQATGSIKTAHSIFRKVYRYLKDNGHIKEA
jgi:hypothetical protein